MEEITLIAVRQPKSHITEVYRTIRTNIQFSKSADKKLKKILMTSSIPNEGKSVTVSNIGAVIAQNAQSVVIVDADFRNPTQHKIFNIANRGVTNCITSGTAVDEFIVPTKVKGLSVIPAGPVPPNPSELLGSVSMDRLLSELSDRFDYVLIDTTPIIPVSDAVIMANKVDGVILLVASGMVSPKLAKEAKDRIEQVGGHIIGAILNKVELKTNRYGYGNYYYYYGSKKNQ